jgi:hypothetical protein
MLKIIISHQEENESDAEPHHLAVDMVRIFYSGSLAF